VDLACGYGGKGFSRGRSDEASELPVTTCSCVECGGMVAESSTS